LDLSTLEFVTANYNHKPYSDSLVRPVSKSVTLKLGSNPFSVVVFVGVEMDHTIVHFEIPAKNLEKLKKFYEDLFAWKFNKFPSGSEMENQYEYWTIETVPVDESMQAVRRGSNGGMYPRQKPEDKPMNFISVESADKYIDKAKELGGKILSPKMEIPNIGWWASIEDPDGNVFGILEPTMPKPPKSQ
jgi:predicted enzyme related to lactoylglutathione lyase